MDKNKIKVNDWDDVFYTDIDESTSQKIISHIEENRQKESIVNVTILIYFRLLIMRHI